MTNKNNLYSLLDAIAILLWGSLLFKYVITGQLRLLIHPNYFKLVLITSLIFFAISIIQILLIVINRLPNDSQNQHIVLFPRGVGSSILLVIAIAGFLIPPKILTSQTALQRGVSELPLTQIKPQAFRTATKPETRSLIDWVRTLNAYPEPDAYHGLPANISGFVLHLPELPDNYIVLSRFVITCCAVDAYPIGIPVKLTTSRNNYPLDSWLEIKGEMITETLLSKDLISATTREKRQLVLLAKSVVTIPTPSDPYSYQ
ncbi:MAG: TIGR03943 family protein [Pleurocapsa sp.]